MNRNLDEDAVPSEEGGTNLSYITPEGAQFKISTSTPHIAGNVQIGTGMVMNVRSNQSSLPNIKAKKPLSTKVEIVSQKLLEDIAKDIKTKDAERLGRYLGLTEAKIDEIDHNYKTDGAREIKYQILAEWKRQDESPLIKKIAKGLSAIGRGDIADKVPH
ncbi:hypothetical protein SNE40_007745 [Patella caerulea]|uniref:Death domain-containing protein n=1 Tax=Patella caerulea TaxID=87958 RepID=A0AAN8JXF7_PATCE